MKMRGIEFGPVWGASGVQGFFGESHPFNVLFNLIPGFDFGGVTFVSKTATLMPCDGNARLRDDGITHKQFMPDCVFVDIHDGVVVSDTAPNSPGAFDLFMTREWQKRTRPFVISFAPTAKENNARLDELRQFITLLKQSVKDFKAHFALQLNFTGMDLLSENRFSADERLGEILDSLDIANQLDVPLIPKISVLTAPEIVLSLENHACDAICVSDAIPWGTFTDKINWKSLFGSTVSPLEKRGYRPGRLSGAPLLPLVYWWVVRARELSRTFPINAGGGILKPEDATLLLSAGANSIFIGSMAFLRPWNMKRTVRAANAWA